MNINKNLQGNTLTLALDGRLDTTTAPLLETTVNESLSEVETLIMDMQGLDYLSSAGLRVLLSSQKKMDKQGKMIVRNVNDTVLEVFEVTGFSDILTIE